MNNMNSCGEYLWYGHVKFTVHTARAALGTVVFYTTPHHTHVLITVGWQPLWRRATARLGGVFASAHEVHACNYSHTRTRVCVCV